MVQFKLQHRGLVRKVTFKNVDQPSWHELSWKIGDVCNIPHAAVALTYLDPDGDRITISSQPELNEYYSSLDEDELDSKVPHKFIVRNLNEGIPDDDASDPREDAFLMRDAQTMAASTVGGGSQWGINPEDEAERDPTKLRLSGYSTFADALSPLAKSTAGTDPDEEDGNKPEKEDLPGSFRSSPSPPPQQPAKSSGGWGLPVFGVWGKSSSNTQPANPPPAETATKAPNPWANNDQATAKTPTWAAASTTPPSTKATPTPWGPPASVALKGAGGRGAPPSAGASTNNTSGAGSTGRPTNLVPPPVAPTMHMDSMVADRATTYSASPAVTATIPRGKKNKKRMTQAERAKEGEAARRAAEKAKFEELELKAMEREVAREREENARASAEAAARAAVEDQRRTEEREWEREWERERERLKAEEEQRKREREHPPHQAHQTHQHRPSDMSYSDEWQHVNNQSPEQEDEQAYRERIEAARANVFGTSPTTTTQPQPAPRQRKSSTKNKGDKSSGKSSRPNSKVYPPTPAPKKFFDSDLAEGSQNGPNMPTTPGYPVTPAAAPANGSTAQVCSDVADLLVSFGRILDSERDLLDAIRETFSRGPTPGALSATFENRNISPEMLRIIASVDDLLTKILPSRPPASPYAGANMDLEPRVPTPSVTPAPTIPAEPEFGIPKTEYGAFEFANRGRPTVPVINVPRPKYPASSLTHDSYSTGTTPPSQSSYYATSPYPSGSPDKRARSRSRQPPPGDFEIVPPSHLPPQARVIPPPVVPGEETDDSSMTPDASRGFTRQSMHESGLVLASQGQRSTDVAKADLEAARQHYKSQRELYKLEKAERKKEMEERAAAKAERRKAKASASADPKITDLTNQLQNLVPPRPYEAERRYVENPYEPPRIAGPYPASSQASTVYAEGLGQVTLVPMGFPAPAAVTAPVSPVHEESSTGSFERARRRRQSLNGGSPERYSNPRAPASTASKTESYHGLQPDAYPGAAHHTAPYISVQPPQQDLAKRVALKLTEMGYTPQKYPTLPSIVGHRIRPLMNTHGVSESELAYHIVQDLFKYTGQT